VGGSKATERDAHRRLAHALDNQLPDHAHKLRMRATVAARTIGSSSSAHNCLASGMPGHTKLELPMVRAATVGAHPQFVSMIRN